MSRAFRKLVFTILFAAGIFSILATNHEPLPPSLTLIPKNHCATTSINVQWANAPDGTQISASPKIFGIFTVPDSSGSTKKSVDTQNAPTESPYLVTIKMAYGTGSESFEIKEDIAILPPGATEQMPVAFPYDCSGGDPPTWTQVIAGDEWDPALKVKSVRNTSGRQMSLTHNGDTETFTPNQLAAYFVGHSPGGTWSASTKLKTQPDPITGEYFACSPIAGTVGMDQTIIRRDPPNLSVEIVYGC